MKSIENCVGLWITLNIFCFCFCFVSISAFASLFAAPAGIASSAVGIKICTITAATKKCKSIIKKKKKNHDKIVLLEKTKLNTIDVLFSRKT